LVMNLNSWGTLSSGTAMGNGRSDGDCSVCRSLLGVRFRFLTEASMTMKAFRDITSCSLVEVDISFNGTYCAHHQGDEKSFNYETTWRSIPEGCQPRYRKCSAMDSCVCLKCAVF
jgi:hypothetical protein